MSFYMRGCDVTQVQDEMIGQSLTRYLWTFFHRVANSPRPSFPFPLSFWQVKDCWHIKWHGHMTALMTAWLKDTSIRLTMILQVSMLKPSVLMSVPVENIVGMNLNVSELSGGWWVVVWNMLIYFWRRFCSWLSSAQLQKSPCPERPMRADHTVTESETHVKTNYKYKNTKENVRLQQVWRRGLWMLRPLRNQILSPSNKQQDNLNLLTQVERYYVIHCQIRAENHNSGGNWVTAQ